MHYLQVSRFVFSHNKHLLKHYFVTTKFWSEQTNVRALSIGWSASGGGIRARLLPCAHPVCGYYVCCVCVCVCVLCWCGVWSVCVHTLSLSHTQHNILVCMYTHSLSHTSHTHNILVVVLTMQNMRTRHLTHFLDIWRELALRTRRIACRVGPRYFRCQRMCVCVCVCVSTCRTPTPSR